MLISFSRTEEIASRKSVCFSSPKGYAHGLKTCAALQTATSKRLYVQVNVRITSTNQQMSMGHLSRLAFVKDVCIVDTWMPVAKALQMHTQNMDTQIEPVDKLSALAP